MSTAPADAQESLALIFSQKRKNAEYFLGELAAGGLLIQLCLCKPAAEESMRVKKEAGVCWVHLSTYQCSDPHCLFGGSFGSRVIAEERGLCRSSRDCREHGSNPHPISEHCQSSPLDVSTDSWPLPTLLSRSKQKTRTALVAQWVRTCQLVQGPRVPSLVQEAPTWPRTAKPKRTCRMYWSPCTWSPCPPTREAHAP